MKVWLRTALLILLLGSAVFGQRALWAHLQMAPQLPAASLVQPLSALPLEIGVWRGQDEPIVNARDQYGDQQLQRVYANSITGQLLTVWMVYSATGVDRGHHPEVCLAVAGQSEDRSVRTTFDLPGHKEPVQQYRFVAGGRGQWVFYWHYTLPSPRDSRLDALQFAFQRTRVRQASLTVEVFAIEGTPQGADEVRQFVALLDAAVQSHVGADAVRGSQRLPVTVTPRS